MIDSGVTRQGWAVDEHNLDIPPPVFDATSGVPTNSLDICRHTYEWCGLPITPDSVPVDIPAHAFNVSFKGISAWCEDIPNWCYLIA
jgi:hypothetical protein